MADAEPLSRDEVVDRLERARALIQEIRDGAPYPVVAHAAHQADMYCHRAAWELGVESGTTPELEEPVSLPGDR